MDILAGIFAYVAGLGVLLAGMALSFFVFFSAPHGSLQAQTQQQNASAMLVRPSTPNKHAAVEAHAKQSAQRSAKESALHSEKHVAATVSSSAARGATIARNHQRKPAASTAQARQLIQEQRARRWAYQQDSSQDSSFEGRFLGYAD